MPPSATHTPRNPWYRRRPDVFVLVGIVGVSALVALLIFGPLFLMVISSILGVGGAGCSSDERAVLEEFPHYTDQRLRPYSAEVSCNVRYTTSANREEVLGRYDQQLHENGWKVGGYWAANPPQCIEVFGEKLSDLEQAPEEGVRSGLEARRGDYSYVVEYYPPGSPAAAAEAGASEEEAMVIVGVTDEPGADGKVGSPKQKK